MARIWPMGPFWGGSVNLCVMKIMLEYIKIPLVTTPQGKKNFWLPDHLQAIIHNKKLIACNDQLTDFVSFFHFIYTRFPFLFLLQIVDGNAKTDVSNRREPGQFCGESEQPQTFISETSAVKIVFHTDNFTDQVSEVMFFFVHRCHPAFELPSILNSFLTQMSKLGGTRNEYENSENIFGHTSLSTLWRCK